MVRRALSLLLTLLFASLLAAQDATFAIGTWNLEFLGAAPTFRRDTPPRTDDDLAAIGKKVAELGVAVLGVEEICGEAPLEKVCAGAGPTWRFVLGTSGSWDDGKTQQGVGFLYDEALVELLWAEELLDFPSELDGLPVFHRKPVTAVFRHRATGCDFRCVVVHLKAGQKAQDEQKRALEATTLQAWIAGLLRDPAEDPDIVVLGDFNCGYDAPPRAILERDGLLHYLPQPHKASTIMHFDDAIDQVVGARGFAELRRDGRRDHPVDGEAERKAFRKTYSDHFPVTATVVARGDDDPDAHFWRGPPGQRLPVSLRRWPPQVGAEVLLTLTSGAEQRGKLLQPLPDAGWIVLEIGGVICAIPVAQVAMLQVAPR
ncbi:MAG: hypothetical protein H6835_13570 [Planctomycetes bacterium]|nr:hypothetical protein [Planctomycetota bacterium]